MQNIRLATREDVKEIKKIMDKAMENLSDKDWYAPDDEAFLERHIDEEGYTLKYVIENENICRIAGFLVVRHPKLAEDNLGRYLAGWDEELLMLVAHMESAAVLPKFRGQRIQQKLLAYAEEIEKKHGMKYLMGTVHPENVYSLRNLEREGYVCLLETKKYGGLRRKIVEKEL